MNFNANHPHVNDKSARRLSAATAPMFDEVVRGTARDYIPLMPRETPDDRDLMLRMTRGETQALRELYARHGRLVYGLALRIVGDQETAEEVSQDVFLRAWEKADTYRQEKAQVRTWLARITRNRAIDVLRRRGSREARARDVWEEMKNELEGRPDRETPAETEELRRRISRAILSLPEEQRAALSLAFFQGQTHRQIAAATGEPVGTVKSRIRGAMLKLRDQLKDEDQI